MSDAVKCRDRINEGLEIAMVITDLLNASKDDWILSDTTVATAGRIATTSLQDVQSAFKELYELDQAETQ